MLSVWQRNLVDRFGNVVPNASVEVRDTVTGELSEIYSDSEGTTTLDNPFTADASGFAKFYASGGLYNITVHAGGAPFTWYEVALGALSHKDKITADVITDDADELAAIRSKLDVTAAEDVLTKDNNLSDLSSALLARQNLGLGTAATYDYSDFDEAGSAALVAGSLEDLESSLGELSVKDTVSEAIGDADAVNVNARLGEFNSVADVEARHIPVSLDSIRTNGYYTPGDGGGALYKRVESEPSHAGKIQSADGAWWEIVSSRIVSVRQFGAKGDGVTDDTQAIKDAIQFITVPRTNRPYGGGVVLFDEGQFLVSETLTIDEHNVRLEGVGAGGYSAGIADLRDTAATRLVWDGPDGDVFVHFTRRKDETNIKNRGGLSNLMLDCQNSAGVGLQLTSWSAGYFHDITIYGATESQIRLTTFAESYGGPQPYDCYRNVFERVMTTCKNLSNNTSTALHIGSGGLVNSCYNRFVGCWLTPGEQRIANNEPAVIFGDSDNNTLISCQANGVIFQSSDSGGPARYNWLHNCEIGGPGVIAEASQTGGVSSYNNIVSGLNNSNASGIIVVQQGDGGANDAHLLAYDTEGFRTRLLATSISMGPGANKFDKEILKISTNDAAGTGRVWLHTNHAAQSSPFLRVTGGRTDTHSGQRFAGRLFLDSYKNNDSVKTNKTLGSVIFGGSVGPNNAEDIRYSAAVQARAADDFASASYCPTLLEFVAGVEGQDFDTNPEPVVMQVKPNGCVRFMPLATAPTDFLEEGDAYYDSTLKTLRVYDGTGWVDLG